jgi:hypothetical protein
MMKHTEDDGDLSIFAGKNQLMVACSKGNAVQLSGRPIEDVDFRG